MGCRRDLDTVRQAMGLHSAGDIHRVAPDVVGELCVPMTPATTSPEWMPMRICRGMGNSEFIRSTTAIMASAISATAWAWSARGSGRPPADNVGSPIVFIFSIPSLSAADQIPKTTR